MKYLSQRIHLTYSCPILSIFNLPFLCSSVLMAESGISEALLDEFRPWLISLTNHDPAGSVPFIPSVSPQTPKTPAGWFEESA